VGKSIERRCAQRIVSAFGQNWESNVKIKNWSKFQHFKDRRPPWVKLYRDLLDDPDWHELDAEAAKILVSLWLLASEDEEQEGNLPDAKRIAFRLRIPVSKVNQALTKLDHWLYHDDINAISERYQSDTPETETETETYTEKEKETDPLDGFSEFWLIYDKKVEKPQAEKSWKKIKPSIELQLEIYAAARTYVQSTPDKKFRKNPSTWLNNQCWNDEVVTEQRKVGFFGTLMNLGESQHEQLSNPFTPRLDG
jgi:hypothetical protein